MYYIVWKYSVPDSNQIKFEKEYGNKGAWSTFFKTSSDYVGSDLIKVNAEIPTYFLLDIWKSEKSYYNFLKVNRNKYSALSSKFNYTFSQEIKLGEFSK